MQSIAAAAPLRATARRSSTRSAPMKASVGVRAMSDDAAGAPAVHDAVELRVGKVLKAYKHPDADKLYVEEVDVGEDEPRQICSGLVPYMAAEVGSQRDTQRRTHHHYTSYACFRPPAPQPKPWKPEERVERRERSRVCRYVCWLYLA